MENYCSLFYLISQITNPIKMSPAAGAGRLKKENDQNFHIPETGSGSHQLNSCGCGPETRKIEKREKQNRNQEFPISKNENESCIVHREKKTADQVRPCYAESNHPQEGDQKEMVSCLPSAARCGS